jgi:uncharacterized protein (TIGR02117 family)
LKQYGASTKVPRAGLGVVIPGLVVALSACTILGAHPGDPSLYPPSKSAVSVPVYLIDNGFHSDLALSRKVIAAQPHRVGRAAAMTSGDPWIVMGWGDAHFYSRQGPAEARAVDAVRALFWPGNASVVRLEGIPRQPDEYYIAGAVKVIQLSPAGVERLLDRVDRSLAVGPDGGPVRAPANDDPDEAFFKSTETFSLLHLCNHWTSEVLNAAGLPTDEVVDTLPAGLKLDLRLRGGVR